MIYNLVLSQKSLTKFLIACSLLCFVEVEAQQGKVDHKSELSIQAGGIFSNLDYDLKKGNVHNSKGYKVGLRYAYDIGSHFSIGLGVGYQYASASGFLRAVTGAYDATDSEGENFEFRYSAKHYNEKQVVDFLNIPLTLQYETIGMVRFYGLIGGKIGVPFQSDYSIRTKSLKTSGYYSTYDGELFGPKFAGFGDYGEVHTDKRDLELKPAFSLMIEAGIKFKSGSDQWVYFGAFLDYGLNGIYDGKKTDKTIRYSSSIPAKFDYNSILGRSETGKVRPFALGVVIRYGMGF